MSEICPYCGGSASVKDSSLIYGRSYGNALICDDFPNCDSYATLYHEGKYMADRELRNLRKTCHDVYFDPLWKFGGHNRKDLYIKLRQLLNINREDAHFGKLNAGQCQQLIDAISNGSFIQRTKQQPG